MLPVSGCDTTLTERLIGPDRFAAMFRSVGVERSNSIEGGRWIVDPLHRSARLGVLLAAGGVAVARTLGFRMLFCPVGTRGGQARALARLGLAPVPELPLIAAPELDDELQVMYVFPDQPTVHFHDLMNVMAAELKLTPDAELASHKTGPTERCT
jgi:hypothetical protein